MNIILVHGWRMKNWDKIKKMFLRKFKHEGFNIYFYTLPYHLNREPANSLYSGELMISANIERTLAAVYQAVAEIRMLTKWLKQKNGGQVILLGISLGGYVTNLTAAVSKAPDALISVFYANSLAYSVWHTIPGKFIKKDFLKHGFTYEKLKEVWKSIEPSNFTPQIKKENIFLLSADYDRYVLNEDSKLLWERWGKPLRKTYPCGHAGIITHRKRISDDVIAFINERSK